MASRALQTWFTSPCFAKRVPREPIDSEASSSRLVGSLVPNQPNCGTAADESFSEGFRTETSEDESVDHQREQKTAKPSTWLLLSNLSRTQLCQGASLLSFPFLCFLEPCPFCSFFVAFRGGPLWCTRFRRVFRSRKWAREIGQKPGEDVVWQRNAGRRQPPPQAHFISPNPPRHSRRSVSDGVIQLRVPLAGCAGFFLQAPIPRRILTKMSEAICCMNMRFAKRSWEHPCF